MSASPKLRRNQDRTGRETLRMATIEEEAENLMPGSLLVLPLHMPAWTVSALPLVSACSLVRKPPLPSPCRFHGRDRHSQLRARPT
jgi:hypothetical protein